MATGSSRLNKMRRQPVQARSQERVQKILDVAEELFATHGYAATTTKEIAAQAQIPIGSLYQFFPNKGAIVQALFVRYNDLLHQQLALSNRAELAELPLSILVDKLTDICIRFFLKHPGYYKTFMEVQGGMPEIGEIEDAADAKLIQEFALLLKQREAIQEDIDYAAIAFVLAKTSGQLIWIALGQEEKFQRQLFTEMKRFSLSYLKSYFPSAIKSTKNTNEPDSLKP
ncbi:MAG: TetR/AcrR family transcriptional regulator [Cyanobacteria bacterium P01_A01_bin.17]